MVWHDARRKLPRAGKQVITLESVGGKLYPMLDQMENGKWERSHPKFWANIPGKSGKCWRPMEDSPIDAHLGNGYAMILTDNKDGTYSAYDAEGGLEDDFAWRYYIVTTRPTRWMDLSGMIREDVEDN